MRLFPIYPYKVEKDLVGDLDKLQKKAKKQQRDLYDRDRRSPYAVEINDTASMIIPGRGSVFGRGRPVSGAILAPGPIVSTVPSTPKRSVSLGKIPDIKSLAETGFHTPAQPGFQSPSYPKEPAPGSQKKVKPPVDITDLPAKQRKLDDLLSERAKLLNTIDTFPPLPGSPSLVRENEIKKKELSEQLSSLESRINIAKEEVRKGQRAQAKTPGIKAEEVGTRLKVVKDLQMDNEKLQAQVKSITDKLPETEKEQEKNRQKVEQLEKQIKETNDLIKKKEEEMNLKQIRANAIQAERSKFYQEGNSNHYMYYNENTGEIARLSRFQREVKQIMKLNYNLNIGPSDVKSGEVNRFRGGTMIFKPDSVQETDPQLIKSIEVSLKKRNQI